MALLFPATAAGADEPHDSPPPRCELASCYDPLFTVQYPHTRTFTTSRNVRFPVPAHYYDAAAAIVLGSGDFDTMEEWSAGSGYRPVRTESGAGVVAWVLASYYDSDLGAYDEAITAFPVSTTQVTIPDTPGAMTAALLDPANRIWTRGLILDEQLPIDAGREYLHIPKEPDPKAMSIDIGSGGDVSLDFAEPDGTPIAAGQLQPDPTAVWRPTLGLATQGGTVRLLLDAATRGNARLRLVFGDIEHPGEIARTTIIARPFDVSTIRVAECCAKTQLSFNPATPYGADLTALRLKPSVLLSTTSLRLVLDIDL